MMFRRVASALARQDWPAVVIELGIVVLGIFLGLQVSNWNEARQERAEERLYLQRLHHDIEQSLGLLRQQRDGLTDWRDRGLATLTALVHNNPAEVTDSGFELRAAHRVSIASLQMATLNELIAGGRINLIREAGMRSAIAELDASIAANNEHMRILAGYAAGVAPHIQKALRPSVDAENWRDVHYDFQALAADHDFQNMLGAALRIQSTNIAWIDNIIESLEAMDALLESRGVKG